MEWIVKIKMNIDYYNCLIFFGNEGKNEKLKLIKNNANFIETVLKIDSSYKDTDNPNKILSKEYISYLKANRIASYDDKIHLYGSTKYWIDKLVEVIDSNNIDYVIRKEKLKYEKNLINNKNTKKQEEILDLVTIIKGNVCAIDRENNTHLTASKDGRSDVCNKIYEEMKRGLKNLKRN